MTYLVAYGLIGLAFGGANVVFSPTLSARAFIELCLLWPLILVAFVLVIVFGAPKL